MEVIENEAVVEHHVIAAAPMPEIVEVEEIVMEHSVIAPVALVEVIENDAVVEHLAVTALMPEVIVTPLGNATIEVALPSNTPVDDAIYMAGNFNDWNAKDERYQLTRQADGNYGIQIHPPLGRVEFKLTRGSWDTTEGDSFVNRQFDCGTEPLEIGTYVAAWRDLGTPIVTEQAVEIVSELAHNIDNQAIIEDCGAINEMEAAAHIVDNQAIIEDCGAINEMEAAAHIVDNQAIIEDCGAINEMEVAHHTENQAIAEACEAIQEAEAKHAIEVELENKEALIVAEAEQDLENQAIAEACEAIQEAEAKHAIEVELENKEALIVAEAAQVIENQLIAEDCEKINATEAAVQEVVEHQVIAALAVPDFETEIGAEVTPVVETQVVEHQVVAEVEAVAETQVVEHQVVAEVEPVAETQVVEHQVVAEVEPVAETQVVEPVAETQVIEHHTVTNTASTTSDDDGQYDHWERDQKFVGDDLKIIEGIGPKIEQLLNDIGILTHRQLSLMKVEFLSELLKTAGKKYASHDPETWPAQAKLAASGKMSELKKLQARIVYGHLDA